MARHVTRRIDRQTVADPTGLPPGEDPWRDFREVERIELDLAFHFRHSLGKVSRFFLELEQHRLMATRCPTCRKVWMPPRVLCADDMSITEWVELPGRGTLEAASLVAGTPTAGTGSAAALGYVRLDGADTLMLQQIRNVGEPAQLKPGRAVKAVWSGEPVGHPMESFWFEPA